MFGDQANTLAGLEEELATWKTRATVVRPRPFAPAAVLSRAPRTDRSVGLRGQAETELEHLQSYMNTSVTAYQQEIVRLRQLLEDNGIEAPKGGTLSARAEDSRSAMVAERDAGV